MLVTNLEDIGVKKENLRTFISIVNSYFGGNILDYCTNIKIVNKSGEIIFVFFVDGFKFCFDYNCLKIVPYESIKSEKLLNVGRDVVFEMNDVIDN